MHNSVGDKKRAQDQVNKSSTEGEAKMFSLSRRGYMEEKVICGGQKKIPDVAVINKKKAIPGNSCFSI
jgi:hypothetical protein